jgi:hypothetical protein
VSDTSWAAQKAREAACAECRKISDAEAAMCEYAVTAERLIRETITEAARRIRAAAGMESWAEDVVLAMLAPQEPTP